MPYLKFLVSSSSETPWSIVGIITICLRLTFNKVNYPPYGVDFPGGRPTGRFTNGKTIVDFLGMHYDS